MTMCILGFCSFTRFSQIINLCRSDISFEGMYMKLFIEKTKIDVYREVNWIYIVKPTGNLCPVKHYRCYFELSLINKISDK